MLSQSTTYIVGDDHFLFLSNVYMMIDEYDLVKLDLSIGTTLFRVFSKTVYKLNLYITII
jgi:hypothetical protein